VACNGKIAILKGELLMPRRLIAVTASSLLLLNALFPIGAAAMADSSDQTISNAIWSGLWTGVDTATGQTDSTQSTDDQSQPADPSGLSAVTSNAPTDTLANGTYFALGDSVAAGYGLAAQTGPFQDSRCQGSNQAYPYLVAQRLNYSLIQVACSGAKAGDLFTKQAVDGPNIPAQIPSAFAHGTPTLITITAGANDVHWQDFLKKCASQFTCGSNIDRAIAKTLIAKMQASLTIALGDIVYQSGGAPPRVIVTGYYNPISSACITTQANVKQSEINWLVSEFSSLNAAIRTVSAQFPGFVTYAPVSFKGHDLCSADPWVQPIGSPGQLHPTAKGQQVIANAIIRAL
jgi:lysophospholipase L1-like esterase